MNSVKKFEELKVSTRTIIAAANVGLDMDKIFKVIPLGKQVYMFEGVKFGAYIDTIHFKNHVRERNMRDMMINMRPKSFRNALNVVMMLDDIKKINFKVSKNGKFQITGCKDLRHAQMAVFAFLETIGEHCKDAIHTDTDVLNVSFEVVMTNVDCGTGFCINRQSLDKIINTTTPYHSLLETSFGYTGVNIKFPVDIDWFHMDVPIMKWQLGSDKIAFEKTPLAQVAPDKKIKKKYNTFLVFHSGQFIMSGMREDTMKTDYDRFISILSDNEKTIKEILHV